jgi:hypothetical protein
MARCERSHFAEQLAIVKLLIAAGGTPKASDLCAAAEAGNLPLVQMFVDEFGLDSNDWRSNTWACEDDNELLNHLLPIQAAALRGHRDVVAFLLPRWNGQHAPGTLSPASLAIANNHLSALQALQQVASFRTSLLLNIALRHGRAQIIAYLLQQLKGEVTKAQATQAASRGDRSVCQVLWDNKLLDRVTLVCLAVHHG